jgi:hypothetical protein
MGLVREAHGWAETMCGGPVAKPGREWGMHRFGWLCSGPEIRAGGPPSVFVWRLSTGQIVRLADRRSLAYRCAAMLALAGSFCQAHAAASIHAYELISRNPTVEAAVQVSRVQLGSWRSALEAAKGWNRIQRQAADRMDGLSARVVPATLPGRGTFYRLWVGPVDRAAVTQFCASLRARHIECIPAPR